MSQSGLQEVPWPPIYDAEQLKSTITDLLEQSGWSWMFQTFLKDPPLCQGDLIELEARFPYINKQGDAAARPTGTSYWLILGNTCDLTRDLSDLEWTNLVPVWDHCKKKVNDQLCEALEKYQTQRRFFVPPWKGAPNGHIYVAEFPQIVTVHKTCLTTRATVQRRLSAHGWLLFHACVVRYLARQDGRNT